MTGLVPLDESWIALCQHGLSMVASALLQSTLLLTLGLLTARALHRHGPRLRSLIYRTTLLGVAGGAVLSVLAAGSLRSVWQVSLPAAAPPALAALPPTDTAPGQNRAPRASASPVVAASAPVPGGADWHPVERAPAWSGLFSVSSRLTPAAPWTGWLYGGIVGVWAAGALLLLVRLGLCHWHVLRLRRGSLPVSEGEVLDLLRSLCAERRVRVPQLLVNVQVQSPFVAGLRQPALLLPADWLAASDRLALRAVFSHELAHLQRWDCGWNLFARLTSALAWPQPLLWRLTRRLEQASEAVCDQEVIEHGTEPRLYARCLLAVAERRVPGGAERLVGAAITPRRSDLGRRIQEILATRRHRTPGLAARTQAGIVLGIASIAGFSPFLVSASASPQQKGTNGRLSSQIRPSATEQGSSRSKKTSPSSATMQRRERISVQDLMLLAGLTPARGPGLVITLQNAKPKERADRDGGRVHDTDLTAILTELRAAGAEAIALSGADGRRHRLTLNSVPQCDGPRIRVNGALLMGPFRIWAIGQPQRMERQLRRPGGVIERLNLGLLGMIRIQAADAITIPAYSGSIKREFAQPVR